MKKFLIVLICLGLVVAFQQNVFAQRAAVDKIELPISKEARDAFFKKAQDYFRALLKDNEYETAEKKFREFLDSEGKELLDSYEIKGSSVFFDFKEKASSTGWSGPLISLEKQELLSSKEYSVSEILKMLEVGPEQFRGKDVLIKGALVDATRCIGCCRYSLLVDAKYADLYLELVYKRNKSEAERQRLEDMPTLKASGTGGSKFKLGKKSYVLRGHFFDPGMKVCESDCCGGDCSGAWKRFVVVEKVSK